MRALTQESNRAARSVQPGRNISSIGKPKKTAARRQRKQGIEKEASATLLATAIACCLYIL